MRRPCITIAIALLAATQVACGNLSPESRILSGARQFVEQAK